MIKKMVCHLFLVIVVEIAYGQPANWINIVAMGASNDGKTLVTEVINSSIQKASSKGGTIYFPAGEYLTGPIVLKSNITLFIDAGAVLRFSDNFNNYLPFVEMRWEGTVMRSFCPLIYANKAQNITITGRGTIDGQGARWWAEAYKNMAEIKSKGKIVYENEWQKLWDKENEGLTVSKNYERTISRKFFRPPFIQTYRCSNVHVEGITIVNSPFWTINPEFCDNVTISGVTILNPDSPNMDGINPESCQNVHISDCHISVSDDCITLKSGRDADGRKYNIPCENITITNCTMLDGHGGVVIGSEMSGCVKNVVISNCVFDGTERGIRLKTMRGRGGVVENIRVNNIIMRNIKEEAIVLDMYYGNTLEEPVSDETPCFRNIHFANITGVNINQICKVNGLTEMQVSEVTFSNINMETLIGFEINRACHVGLHDIVVKVANGPAISVFETNDLFIDNVRNLKPANGIPVIKLDDVQNVFVHSCLPAMGTDLFLLAQGAKSRNIQLQNNDLSNVIQVLSLGADVIQSAVVVKP